MGEEILSKSTAVVTITKKRRELYITEKQMATGRTDY
jgi:hypothetical protein